MPSMLPLLNYGISTQGDSTRDESFGPASLISEEIGEISPKSASRIVEKKETKNVPKSVGRRPEISSKEVRKSGKKKRRPAEKVSRGRESSSNNVERNADVEELVRKVTAHAVAGQALKKAVLEIQLCLLDGVKEMSQLLGSRPLLTQSEYADVVTERSIAKQCGFPLCTNGLVAEENRKSRFRISLREHKVYDLRQTELFCCANCLVSSKTFQSSLQVDRDKFARKERLNDIVDSVRDPTVSRLRHSYQNSHDYLDERIQSNISAVADIQERLEVGICSFDEAGPYNAIEGYVPKNTSRHLDSYGNAEVFSDATRNHLEGSSDSSFISSSSGPGASIMPRKEGSTDEETSVLCDQLNELDIAEEPRLKSALKKEKSGRSLNRNVSWKDLTKKVGGVDESLSPRLKDRSKVHHQTATMKAGIPVPLNHSSVPSAPADKDCSPSLPVTIPDTPDPERLLAAKALATALVEAADTASGGEIGSVEAVSRAGISIIPASENAEDSAPTFLPNELKGGGLSEKMARNGIVKAKTDARWPLVEQQDAYDVEISTGRSSWHDAPPSKFKLEVSSFGIIWMALEEWISAATIAYIYEGEPKHQEKYLVTNGRDYRIQEIVQDGTSAEISRTFSSCISRAFPHIVQALQLNVPLSSLEQTIGRLVKTMTFVEPLPGFGTNEWHLILILLLDSLSAHQLPMVGVQFANNLPLLRKVVTSTGISEAEYDIFRDLMLPLGPSTLFSASQV